MTSDAGRRPRRCRMAAGALVLGALLGSAATAREGGLFLPGGAPTTLEEHIAPGEWTVVMIWATTCAICRAEFPKYSRFHLRGGGRRVLGIALDGLGNAPAVDRFYARTGAKFPTLLADVADYGPAYRRATGEDLRGTPTFMLYDPGGNLVGLNPGPMRVEALERFIARKM